MQKWTREEMAEASGLSRNTIRNLESGELLPRGKTLEKIWCALEEVGIEFTEDGVRRRRMDVKIIRGCDGVEIFLDHLFTVAKKNGGEILGVFPSQKAMIKALGVKKNNTEQLKKILIHADMKFLLGDIDAPQFSLDHFYAKLAPESCNCATSYFVFGNSCATVCHLHEEHHKYIIFNDINMALGNKTYFLDAWTGASFLSAHSMQKRETRIRA